MLCSGTWVAQSVEHQTLDFGSGHDPRVMGSSPTLGSTLSVETALDYLSVSPYAPLPCLHSAHALSLSLKKKKCFVYIYIQLYLYLMLYYIIFTYHLQWR